MGVHLINGLKRKIKSEMDKDLGNIEDKSQESVDIATAILKSLMEYGTDEITAQAALGNAWYRLCKGINYPPSQFWEMTNGMGQMYEKDYEMDKN